MERGSAGVEGSEEVGCVASESRLAVAHSSSCVLFGDVEAEGMTVSLEYLVPTCMGTAAGMMVGVKEATLEEL